MWWDYLMAGPALGPTSEMSVLAFVFGVILIMVAVNYFNDKPNQWNIHRFTMPGSSIVRACILKEAASSKGSFVACGHRDGSLEVINLDNGSLVFEGQAQKDSMLDLVELPNQYLATSSWDPEIKIWDLCTKECVGEFAVHEGAVKCLLPLPQNQLASGSWDKTVKITDLSTGKVMRTFNFSHPVEALARIPDNRIAVASGAAVTIVDLNSESEEGIQVLGGHSRVVSCLTLVDNDTLASGSFDSTVKIWSLSKGTCSFTMTGHTSRVTALTPYRQNRVASASSDRSLRIWDTTNGICMESLHGHSRTISSLQTRHDGALVSACRAAEIRLWLPN